MKEEEEWEKRKEIAKILLQITWVQWLKLQDMVALAENKIRSDINY